MQSATATGHQFHIHLSAVQATDTLAAPPRSGLGARRVPASLNAPTVCLASQVSLRSLLPTSQISLKVSDLHLFGIPVQFTRR